MVSLTMKSLSTQLALRSALLVGGLIASHGQAASPLNSFLGSLGVAPEAIPPSARESNGTQLACLILGQLYPKNTVVESSNTIYTSEREAHWSATAWEYPDCIFTATNTPEVVNAVRVLEYTQSPYAVRSGGHSPLAGWANTDGGVLLSLANLTDIAYNAQSQTVRAGFGLRWLDVYNYIEQFGRLVVGGRVTDVGQALTLGGGLSHLSNLYGFSGDNVVSFEVILANASVVNASRSSHSDLYWALKGGSSNFGIVTHMEMRTYPVGRVWGGTVVYNDTYVDALMQAFATYQASGQKDKKSAIITDMVTTANQLVFTFVYLEPVARPACFQPFYAIPSLVDGTQSFDNFTALVGGPLNTGIPRWTWGTTTIYLDERTYVDVANLAINETARLLANVTGATLVLFPQPISISMVEAAQSRGGNPLGLVARPQLWWTLSLGWELPSDDNTVYEAVQVMLNKTNALTQSRGLWNRFTFMNDAFSTQNVISSYGASNVATLQSVARRYDQGRMFQKQVPGGFKLP